MRSPFDRGIFTLSLDFELIWGSRDLFEDPRELEAQALVTRSQIFEPLVAMLESNGITATWATVGHLFLADAQRSCGVLHPEIIPPKHRWRVAPWFDGVPDGSEESHPAWYGRSLIRRLQAAGQDIGSHSFSHPIFGDAGCSAAAADTDLARCVAAAEEVGVTLRSFVFPRNQAGHVPLLAKHGFTCWRSPEPVWYRHPGVPAAASRAAHFAEVAVARTPPTVLPFRGPGGLWCIPASGSFLPSDGIRGQIPLRRRTRRATSGIDRAARDRRLSHFWLHPINLTSAPERQLRAIRHIVEHAARLRDRGQLEILSMAAVAERATEATA
ncbi:MAG: peptidoglycan/xylan/chitin deacetylase (PgdA/CDA1 family) [Myxococcota bacterium]|jgi:peptidoglycan/xylan/chitin deacetylase (PgdA/CDA1 family)